MIVILVAIVITLIAFIWTYMMSINFFVWDFKNLYSDVIQSKIVNQRNFELSDTYVQSYNSDSWNNDYRCDNIDNDCLFRSLFWFIPPESLIDLWNFYNLSWDSINFEFTWNITNSIDVWIYEIDWSKNIKDSFIDSGYLEPKLNWNDYNIKIRNNNQFWIQYFVYLSWWEWIKDFTIDESSLWQIWYDYSFFNKKWFILWWDISFIKWFTVNIEFLLEILWFSQDDENRLSKIHYNAWWNDINGLMIYTDNKSLMSWENLFIDGFTWATNCDEQVTWYYWNPAIWDIVWPLDYDGLTQWQLSWYYNDLAMQGWFFTSCDSNENHVYWEIIFKQNTTATEIFSIQAWREYTYTWNTLMDTTNFTESLYITWYNWFNHPVWIISDTIAWLWFIWWEFVDSSKMRDIIDYHNLWNNVPSILSWFIDNQIQFNEPIWWYVLR